MRLIDADKVPLTVVQRTGEGQYLAALQCTIEQAPTVDAIPVWWIEREIKMTEHLCGCVTYHEALDRALKNWREEQGK